MLREFDFGLAPSPSAFLSSANSPEAVYTSLDEAGVAQLYPGFEAWFIGTVIPGLRTGERRVVTSIVDGAIAGVAISKRTQSELKLCTLWVAPQSRRIGIATELAKDAFAWLGTERPVFTVPEELITGFEKLLRQWSFSDHVECRSLYRPRRIEHVFNGRKAH